MMHFIESFMFSFLKNVMYIYKTIFCDLITEKLVSLLHIRHVDKPISTELKKIKVTFYLTILAFLLRIRSLQFSAVAG